MKTFSQTDSHAPFELRTEDTERLLKRILNYTAVLFPNDLLWKNWREYSLVPPRCKALEASETFSFARRSTQFDLMRTSLRRRRRYRLMLGMPNYGMY